MLMLTPDANSLYEININDSGKLMGDSQMQAVRVNQGYFVAACCCADMRYYFSVSTCAVLVTYFLFLASSWYLASSYSKCLT
jgi:uncharacterized protein (UPF0212 family)